MMIVRTKKMLLCVALVILGIIYLCTYRCTNENVSLKHLLAASIRAAELGGFEVVAVHGQMKYKIESKGRTKEGADDVVTAADYRSHCVMYGSLTAAFPGITVISEETSQDCEKTAIENVADYVKIFEGYDIRDDVVNIKDVTIWIDPLDATKEFTENLLQYVTTMVCIVVKGQPIIGIIYKPFETNQNYSLYWTWDNYGVSWASWNFKNLPKAKSNGKPVLIVSRSHTGQAYNISKTLFGDKVEIVSAGGAGYKFLEVAVENASAYVHTTAIKKWDICAGTAMIRSLGGTVTQLYDQQPLYFGPNDPTVLTKGLLAAVYNYEQYSKKFMKFQSSTKNSIH